MPRKTLQHALRSKPKHRSRRLRLDLLEDRVALAVDLPVYHSLPSAPATLFLDFDGHFEATWGAYSNITTPVYDTDGDASTFSAAELAKIHEVWATVAEDYAPFNIDVTTVEPGVLAPGMPSAAANGIALRVAIGGDLAWTGTSYAGLANINSFTSSTPNVCFVEGSGSPGMGSVASHEAGHSFGLSHQTAYDASGNEIPPYTSTWGPLMYGAIVPTECLPGITEPSCPMHFRTTWPSWRVRPMASDIGQMTIATQPAARLRWPQTAMHSAARA
jgi:hypothetical protein